MASSSLKYARQIKSLNEHEEQPGETLVTTNHDVIKRWAEERQARPATVPGKTFDARKLRFIYQEHTRDGKQSNFFRLENPEREDA
jgi:uncharacterized protein involved in type VI secretion and phage assembly